MRRYLDLLGIPGVGRLTAAVLLARVATSMLSLALLVATTQLHGYANAGLLLTTMAVATATAGPVRGRTADRKDPRTVMLWLLAAHTATVAALVAGLTANAPVAVLAVTTAAMGATVPPSGPLVRAFWPSLVPKERLPTAYAFDAALNTATFLTGPLIAGGLLLAMNPTAVVAVTVVVAVTGNLLVALTATTPGRKQEPQRGSFFGPLAHGGVRLLLAMIAMDTFAFGCLQVAAVAAAEGTGTAGVLTSALALGAVVSGVAYGARTCPGTQKAQLVALHAGGATVLAAAGLGGAVPLVVVAATYTLYGLVNGPVETLQQVLVGEQAPEGHRIEAFAWVFSVMWAGFGVGTTIAGRLVTDGDPANAMFAAAAGQALVALVALIGMRGTHHGDT